MAFANIVETTAVIHQDVAEDCDTNRICSLIKIKGQEGAAYPLLLDQSAHLRNGLW